MVMRFALISELPADGKVSTAWIKTHQARYSQKPTAVRAEYEKLVKSLAQLHIIEKALREEVLHVDDQSSDFRSSVAAVLSTSVDVLLTKLLTKI